MNSQMSKPNDLQRIIKSSFETTKTHNGPELAVSSGYQSSAARFPGLVNRCSITAVAARR